MRHSQRFSWVGIGVIGAILAACPLCGAAVAETAPAARTRSATAPATPKFDEHLAESLAAAFQQVIETRDLAPLKDSIDPDFVGVMPTAEVVHGYGDLKKYWAGLWKKIGTRGDFKVRVNLTPARVLGNIALLDGTTDLIMVYAGGAQIRGTVAWTAVLRRDGDRWRVIQAEGTIDPLDNQLVRTNFHRVIIIWSGLALFVGMGLGVAGWRFWLTREAGAMADDPPREA